MSPRLLYLLSPDHALPCRRDRIDAWTPAARMPGPRRLRWARAELALAA
jgi:hypothetical protein